MRLPILVTSALSSTAVALVHPGLLHTEDDFARIRSFVDSGDEPWKTGWDKLAARTNANYEPNPQAKVCRGKTDECSENYGVLYRDIHSAYVNAIYWKVTGDTAFADAAARTLDGWSSTLTEIIGSTDLFLAAGIYGYQFANAAEILRDYEAWTGLKDTIDLLLKVFYPRNHDFLIRHNGTPDDHYWANVSIYFIQSLQCQGLAYSFHQWDLCNLAAMHAIGVLADDQAKIDEAITYFKDGHGNGAIEHTIWTLHEEEGTGKVLGQNQEAGRDQGHAQLVFALLGVLAQQSYNQGEDLFEYLDNRILAG